MHPELAQIIALLRSDAPEEIEKSIDLLQNKAFSFSMMLCGDRELAERAIQAVPYRGLRQLARIEDPSALAVWLYTPILNHCRRMRRAGNAEKQVSLDDLMPGESELALLPDDSSLDPENNLLQSEVQRLLQEAVLRLVVVLHDTEELSTEEVAQILDFQPETVRARLHRVRLIVRKEIRSLINAVSGTQRAVKKSVRMPRRRSVDCRKVFRNASEYVDGRMEQSERLREHIGACPSCAAFISDLRASVNQCRTLKVNDSASTSNPTRALHARRYLRMRKAARKQASDSLG